MAGRRTKAAALAVPTRALPPGTTDLHVELDPAVIAAIERPDPTTNRVTVVSFVATTAAVAFVVFGAARDRAVSVNDQRARARGHGTNVTDG